MNQKEIEALISIRMNLTILEEVSTSSLLAHFLLRDVPWDMSLIHGETREEKGSHLVGKK